MFGDKLSKSQRILIWSLIIGVIVLALILAKIPFKEALGFFLNARIEYVIAFFAVSFAIMALNGLRWWIILKSQGHKLPYWTVLAYKYAGFGVNFITPGPRVGGEPVRAGLLAKHGIEFHKGFASVVIDKTVELSMWAVFFIIGVVTVLANFALPENFKLIVIGVAILFIIGVFYFFKAILTGEEVFLKLLLFFRINKMKKFKSYKRKILVFEERIRKFYKEDRKEFIYAVIISAIAWLLMFLEYKYALLMLGLDVPFMQIFFIFTFVGIAYMLPVPLALGVMEAGQISIFKIFNREGAAGVALSLLIRGRDFIWALIGFFVLSYYGFSYSSEKEKNGKNNNSK
ncbi:MAG: lysylphosphatidylglycerol synthase transmembrane domain-containing protein [archaeon]